MNDTVDPNVARALWPALRGKDYWMPGAAHATAGLIDLVFRREGYAGVIVPHDASYLALNSEKLHELVSVYWDPSCLYGYVFTIPRS